MSQTVLTTLKTAEVSRGPQEMLCVCCPLVPPQKYAWSARGVPGPVLEAGLKSGEQPSVIADGHIDCDAQRSRVLGVTSAQNPSTSPANANPSSALTDQKACCDALAEPPGEQLGP